MSNSFYGGRKGESFVIAARYQFIDKNKIYNDYDNIIQQECAQLKITKEEWIKRNCMVEAFSQGSQYEVVNYDEFIIIDSPRKGDLNNGKIYKRGYNYQDPLGGAIYVGQIVGPSGLAPQVELSTIETIKNLQKKEGFDYRKSEGSYNVSNSLVPGRVGQTEQYNDDIKWMCCSVRDEFNKDTIAYIGFTFPYLVIDYTAKQVSHYDTQKERFNFIERVDQGEHPYYEKWELSVPHGIKGDTFKNFRVITASEKDGVQNYNQQQDDRNNARQILVYDYYNYDQSAEGTKTSIYLGDYNMIKDININDEGTVNIDYSHDDTKTFVNKFKWINNISITQQGLFTVNYNYGGEATKYQTNLAWIDKVNLVDNGTLTFTYNNGKTVTYDKKLKWITGVNVADDGTVKVNYNNGTGPDSFDKKIKWIDNIKMEDNGTVQVNYNNGSTPTSFTNRIKWINTITLADNGTLTFKYNNNTTDTVFLNKIKWISNIILEPNGQLSIHFNNGEPDLLLNQKIRWITGCSFTETGAFQLTFNDGTPAIVQQIDWVKDVTISDQGLLTLSFNNPEKPAITRQMNWVQNVAFDNTGHFKLDFVNRKIPSIEQNIKWINNIKINDNETENQKIHVEYNDGTNTDIGQPINYIIKMAIEPVSYHLLVLYSDPAKRGKISYADRSDWYDMGCVKNYDGVLIGTNYVDNHFSDSSIYGIIKQLDKELPNGFPVSDIDRHGKIVTVGNSLNNKRFFAFDYHKDQYGKYAGWYFLGDLSGADKPGAIAGGLYDEDVQSLAATLPAYSLWFIVE